MAQREARLRPEFAGSYPGISAGVWHNATWLTEVVIQRRRRGLWSLTLEGRPLSEQHFEFQGLGPPQGRPAPKRRVLEGDDQGQY